MKTTQQLYEHIMDKVREYHVMKSMPIDANTLARYGAKITGMQETFEFLTGQTFISYHLAHVKKVVIVRVHK